MNKENLLVALIPLLLVAIVCLLSWLITCGIIKLICMCFSLTFSWGVATGIWLVMMLMRSVFQNNSNK